MRLNNRATAFKLLILALFCGFPWPGSAGELEYVLYPLIDPEDPNIATEGVDINNHGQVLADSWPNGWFIWEDGNVTFADSTLSGAPLSINDLGDVTGYKASNATESTGWLISNGVEQLLEELPGGQMWSRPQALNNVGDIYGYSLTGEENARHVVRWDYDGTAHDLGEPVYSDSRLSPEDVNDSGIVVGIMSQTVSSGARAWKMENGKATFLPDHADHPAVSALASGINADSSIVGMYSTSTRTAAALWTSSGVELLDNLPGITFGLARDINDLGIIVGWSTENDGLTSHATIWLPDGTAQKLSDLTTGTEGWELAFAEAVNNRGDIVGRGTDPDGILRGFVLRRVPEPSTCILALIGLCLAGSRRR